MGSNTIITRNDDGSLRVHGSHLWAPAEHASGYVAPYDHGLVGWSMDPAAAFGTSQPSTGVVSLARVNLGPKGRYAFSTLWASLASGGWGLRDCYLGVYSIDPEMDTATLVATSRDLSDRFAEAGELSARLREPVTVHGRPHWVLAGLLVGGASTPPTFRGAVAQGVVNANLTGLARRFGSVGRGLSRLPRSFGASEVDGPGCAFWAAAG